MHLIVVWGSGHYSECLFISPGKYHCTVDLLFDWFGLAFFANKNKNCQLSYSWFQTSQPGGQQYSDTSPFSIAWSVCPFVHLPISTISIRRFSRLKQNYKLSDGAHAHVHTRGNHAHLLSLGSISSGASLSNPPSSSVVSRVKTKANKLRFRQARAFSFLEKMSSYRFVISSPIFNKHS